MKKNFGFGSAILLVLFLVVGLVITLLLIKNPTAFKPRATGSNDTPPIIVQYHTWWDTRYGPDSVTWPQKGRPDKNGLYAWGGWDYRDYGERGKDSPSPDTIKANGWQRYANTTKDYYPMIGLYDTDDTEVLRWDIKLAKAAGIKAFAVSTYLWGPPKGDRLVEIMKKFLDVAKEEDFHLTWEIWWGESDMADKLVKYKDIFNHPNFYKVDGKPMLWIAPSLPPWNFFGNNIAEFDQITTNIENKIGFPLMWAVNSGNPNIDFSQTRKSIIMMTSSSLFGDNPNTSWKNEIDNFHSKGMKIGTHLYPGFDEAVLNRPDARYFSRDGGKILQTGLQKSNEAGANYIFLESWNDFGESTAIEPGLKEDFYQEPYKMDYYKDLRMIGDFTGVPFIPPAKPPTSSLDPLVVDRLSNKLEFIAKVGMGKGAECSNGVHFGLSTRYSDQWVEIVGKNVGKNDGVVDLKADITPLFQKNVTLLLAVDSNGNACGDWAHWLQAGIYRNGQLIIDLINTAPTAHWHSTKGDIKWGTGGPNGTAQYATNVVISDNSTWPRTIYAHPDYSDNGFTHAGYDNLDLTQKPSPPISTATGPRTTPTPTMTPTPTPVIPMSANTYTGEYFSNQILSGPATFIRNDNLINFDWGSGFPDSRLPKDHFSVRWTRAPSLTAGTYRFVVTADDGVRLKVDGKTIIDKWKNQAATTYSAIVDLTAGTHTIVLEYYENGGNASVRLNWAK